MTRALLGRHVPVRTVDEMARPLRVQFEGAVYHINSVGVRRTTLFPDEAAYEMFLAVLGVAVKKYGWRCAAYCLMTNHYHLLVQTPLANIARGMQFLNGVYAQWFNLTYGERGHVFMSRYYDVVVESDDQLLRAFRYIALNPVLAGVCERPAAWPWGSYSGTVGVGARRRFLDDTLLANALGEGLGGAREALRHLVESVGRPEWSAPAESRLGGVAPLQGLTP